MMYRCRACLVTYHDREKAALHVRSHPFADFVEQVEPLQSADDPDPEVDEPE